MSAKGFMIGRNRDARAAIRIVAIALAASTLAGCYPATVPYTAAAGAGISQ